MGYIINKFKAFSNIPSWLIWTFALLGLSVGFILAPYGIDMVDEPYMIVNALYPKSIPLAPLFAHIGHLFGSLFGYNYLPFRVLSILIYDFSVIVSSIYYYRRKGNLKLALILIGLCSLLPMLYKESVFSIYGWDSLSTLGCTLCTIIILSIVRKPRKDIIIFLALLASATTLFRIPNIIIVPIIIFIIFIIPQLSIRTKLLYNILFIAIYVIVTALIILIMFDSIDNYIECYKQYTMGAHNIFDILYRQISRVLFVVMMTSLLYICFLLFKAFSSLRITILISAILIMILYHNALLYYEFSIYMIYISLFLFIAVCAIMQNLQTQSAIISIVAILMCGYMTACGSNLGIIKYCTFPLLPLLFIWVDNLSSRGFLKVLSVTILSIFIISIYKNMRTTKDDAPLIKCTNIVKIPAYFGLKTAQERACFLDEFWQLKTELESSGFKDIIFLGSDENRYTFEYLLNAPNMALRNDWSFDNKFNVIKNAEWVHDKINNIDDLAIIVLNDESWENSIVEQTVKKNLKLASKTDNFLIYKKTSSIN